MNFETIYYHQRYLSAAFALAVVLLVPGCTNVVTKTWPAATDGGYPEQIGQTKSKLTLGIAFSGGGTRAAPAALGQLQALNDLGLMKQVDYISSVSGGTWAVVPYVFLPKTEKFSDEKFLGAYTSPEELETADLDCAKQGSLAGAISDAKFSLFSNNLYFSALKGKGDETFASYLGNIFLRPFDLKNKFHKSSPLYSREYFTMSEKIRDDLIVKNKKYGINLTTDDFYVARDGRPFLIVNSTLMPFHSPNQDYFLPVEITPMYVGIPVKGELIEEEFVGESSEKILIEKISIKVGGYVEPLAYDSKLEKHLGEDNAMMLHANPVHGFSLSDVLAASGAAPQQTLHRGGMLNALSTNLGFPEFVYWSGYEKSVAHERGKEFDHGDGGHLDNLGIMPLLARQVDNILVLVNTPVAFQEDSCEIDENVTSLFEHKNRYVTYLEVARNKPHNEVFKGENEYSNLLNAFADKKRKGNPLVYCQNYQVKDNPRFNVKEKKIDGSNYEPKVCWVYLDRTRDWLSKIEKNCKLVAPIKRSILSAKGEFKRFPHYLTFFNDLPSVTVIDKSAPQVNLLANLTAWTIREASGTIADAFGVPIINPTIKLHVTCPADARANDLNDRERYMVKIIRQLD